MLEVENLRVLYGGIEAVRRVSLRVDAGEVVALIGRNGAGKSSVLKAISGAVRASGGSIRWCGQEITALRPAAIVKLGIGQVAEGRRIFLRQTVRDNLELGAFVWRGRRAQVRQDIEAMYEMFPVLRRKERNLAGSLSGGEQQMLAMAQALMARPTLLICDEPSLGLAPAIVDQIYAVMAELSRRGTAILVAEQMVQRSLALAHRAYVLETGEVAISGAGAELRHHPVVVETYLGHAPAAARPEEGAERE